MPAISQQKLTHSFSRQAEGCCVTGHYQQAEALYQQALAVAEAAFGAEHLEVATVLNNLAVVCKYLGRFAEAGPLYQRALTDRGACVRARSP